MLKQGKILITGASGFMGRNLSFALKELGNYEILEVNSQTTTDILIENVLAADFIVHLAGVNRPTHNEEFYRGNSDLTKTITNTLLTSSKKTPLIFISSIHASLDNDYGKSKRLALQYILDYSQHAQAKVYIFKLTNTFGRWARINLHSVVATFCHNIAHDKEILINDRSKELSLIYIDDLIEAFTDIIKGTPNSNLVIQDGYYEFSKIYPRTLGYIADTLYKFKKENLHENTIEDDFEKKLYTTYLSYKD